MCYREVTKIASSVKLDTIHSYVQKGASLHPLLYKVYLYQLARLEKQGYLCLLPSTVFEVYHERVLEKKAVD